MVDTVQDWVELVDAIYPEREAAGWDEVGLHVGDPRDPVTRVLVTLDVTEQVLEEAGAEGAELVLAHHPLLFRPLSRLTPSTASGRLALRAARGRIAVLAAHTNLDVAVPGTTDPIVEALGLVDVRPLDPLPAAGDLKLVVFVPTDATAAVIDGLARAGAGVIGEYTECSFRVSGTGTFRPSAAADPTVGEREQRNEVTEDRLELLVPASRLAEVLAALVQVHPYEEVAYDVYPLVAPPPMQGGASKGIGRVGRLSEPLPLREVADRLAVSLPSPHLRLVGEPDRLVERVAACGGAGDSYIDAARRSGADVYVTGDLRHHVSLDALTVGMALIDAGHYATEAAALPAAMDRLGSAAHARGLTAGLLRSRVRTEPWAAYRPPAGATDDWEGAK
jgi:dinuclear metal center YbgI/SA1388 family protein